MIIQSITKDLFPLIKEFLLPYEHTCVQLSMYARKESSHLFVITKDSFEKITKINQIFGVLYANGTLLHCIPDISNLDSLEFKSNFLKFIGEKNVKCLSGDRAGSDFLISIITSANNFQKPYQTFIYNLLILTEDAYPPRNVLSCDDYIKRLTEDDLEALIDIQKKYLIKEVAPIGKDVSDLEAAMSMRQILKNQLALALLTDEEIVAKANTNAIGWNWVQIGGVFTHPLYRRNGYAYHLVYNLCQRIRKTQKNITLFVKEKNNPAFELYKKIGFQSVGKYHISYFK